MYNLNVAVVVGRLISFKIFPLTQLKLLHLNTVCFTKHNYTKRKIVEIKNIMGLLDKKLDVKVKFADVHI